MKIVFFGNGPRGAACLDLLRKSGYSIDLAVAHPAGNSSAPDPFADSPAAAGLTLVRPPDPNGTEFQGVLRGVGADLFVLAGYGKILKAATIALARRMCINLHGGKLPKYRGSSPMNWALMNGETEFGLSVIRVDAGVDTGDVLVERVFPILPGHTIADLHRMANEQFPLMMLEAVRGVEGGTLLPRRQDPAEASYYPLRFAEDGFVLWDTLTAVQIHDRIRALTEPYPCAFSYYGSRKVRLLASSLPETDFFGEPGRIYRVSPSRGVLVCASDKCLWIARAAFEDGSDFRAGAERYAMLATVRGAVLSSLVHGGSR